MFFSPVRWWRLLFQSLLLLGFGAVWVASPAVANEFQERQWHLDAMSAKELWATSKGEGVVIAVLDSGVDPVPELQGRIVDEKNFAGKPPSEGSDGHAHGTFMATLISGTGKSGGVLGLAPGVDIMSLQTVHRESWIGGSEGKWVHAIRYAADHGARIINLSQAVFGLTDGQARRLRSAVEYAQKKGVLIFAATGNDAMTTNDPGYPSVFPGVVGVGAVDQMGKVADFSNYGPAVKLAAPGVDIPGRCESGHGLCRKGGTSASTALASASAALIWSKHPTWTGNQVLRVMMQTASKPKGKVPSPYIGYGIIRPGQVLIDGKGDPGNPDVNPLLPREDKGEAGSGGGSSSARSVPPSKGVEGGAGPEGVRRVVNGAASDGDGDGGGGSGFLWVLLGGGGVVVVAVTASLFARARRSQTTV
ncbi:S8 family serine peptidase [Streptomyces sp. HSW2009]|uniref:S8 family serine peptidase n=1 Tax=Streptomyces sp. HSW2009 TaxID=3142890 RepID=UPI0032F07D6B